MQYGFNRDPHFQRVMVPATAPGGGAPLTGFNRDPHFQRVMVTQGQGARAASRCFNRDPHFQRVMDAPVDSYHLELGASIGTLIFRG